MVNGALSREVNSIRVCSHREKFHCNTKHPSNTLITGMFLYILVLPDRLTW